MISALTLKLPLVTALDMVVATAVTFVVVLVVSTLTPIWVPPLLDGDGDCIADKPGVSAALTKWLISSVIRNQRSGHD